MDERDDWVADVRRWCLSSRATPSSTSRNGSGSDEGSDVGYEAAHPVLQSRHWPDAPGSEFGALS